MSWIRKRLTPNKEEIKEDFVDMVKALSVAVPEAVKENDQALDQYRYHQQASNDIKKAKESLQGKFLTLRKNISSTGSSNLTDGIKFLEDTIDLEISAHESIRRVYMLRFSLKGNEEAKKKELQEKIPKLEELVDQIMFQRMRWDLHYINMSAKQTNTYIAEEQKG